MRFQKRIPGQQREQLSSGVKEIIKRKITNLAIRFNCSKSFVVSTILADALKIQQEEKYYVVETGRVKKRGRGAFARKRA